MMKMNENEKMEMEKVEAIETDLVLDSAKIVPIKDFVSPENLHEQLLHSIRKYHTSADISMICLLYTSPGILRATMDSVSDTIQGTSRIVKAQSSRADRSRR